MKEGLIKKAYRKLKSNVYYDHSMLYLKLQIAEYEYSEGAGDSDIEWRLNSLLKKYNSDADSLFKGIYENIQVRCYPKAISDTSVDNTSIITNVPLNESKICVDKLNYFIEMPVEAHILGVLWILIIGRL